MTFCAAKTLFRVDDLARFRQHRVVANHLRGDVVAERGLLKVAGKVSPAGVPVVDPLDDARFTWNPPKVETGRVGYGYSDASGKETSFTLYCGELILDDARPPGRRHAS